MKKAFLIGTAVVALGVAGVALAHGGGWKGHQGRHGGYHQGHHGEHGFKGRRGRGGERAERRLDKRFTELDADKDGLVTGEEIEAAHAERFKKMDGDGDGSVDARELVEYHMLRRAERRIARMDKNNDGVLQADEMPQRRGMMRFDLDNNGSVSRAEIELGRRGKGGGRHWRRGPDRGDGPRGEDDAAPKAPTE